MPFDDAGFVTPLKVVNRGRLQPISRPASKIGQVRQLLGPNGERWVKGAFETAKGRYCILGAVYRVYGSKARSFEAIRLINDAISPTYRGHLWWRTLVPNYEENDIMIWNDNSRRKWHEVNRVLERAEQMEMANAVR